MQNRGEFSIVVHPNTGYEYEDHSLWAMWSGQVWPLDMTIFRVFSFINSYSIKNYNILFILPLSKFRLLGIIENQFHNSGRNTVVHV